MITLMILAVIALFIKSLRLKFDFVDTNLIILWYGNKKRKYIKLFRI